MTTVVAGKHLDAIHLHRHDAGADRVSVLEILTLKCEFKGIAVPTLQSLRGSAHHGELRADWDQMLAHQLPQLPPFDSFWEELRAACDGTAAGDGLRAFRNR